MTYRNILWYHLVIIEGEFIMNQINFIVSPEGQDEVITVSVNVENLDIESAVKELIKKGYTPDKIDIVEVYTYEDFGFGKEEVDIDLDIVNQYFKGE